MMSSNSERGALHLFGMLGFVLLLGVIAFCLMEWQAVSQHEAHIRNLYHRIDQLETRIKVVEGRQGF
ncbi:MAG: hypothetical protein K1X83_04405 [Oligoflexia bacterium]|nr:hypothetical protein [Oligoflexia bacterium]